MSVFQLFYSGYIKTMGRSRLLHRSFHRVSKKVLIPLLEKAKGFHTIDNDYLGFRLAFLTLNYDRETVKLIRSFVKPGMTVLDIGAHIGYFTKILSNLVGETGQVIAFEPHPRVYTVLCKNVESLSNVQSLQMALTDQKGTAVLYDSPLMSGGAFLSYDEQTGEWHESTLSGRETAPRILKDSQVQSYNVKTTTIDSYLAEQGVEKIDFIKMDIEGCEIAALKGMEKTIFSSPRLSMVTESFPPLIRKRGFEPAIMFQELKRLGFRVYVIEAKGLRLADQYINELTTESVKPINLFCAKE